VEEEKKEDGCQSPNIIYWNTNFVKKYTHILGSPLYTDEAGRKWWNQSLKEADVGGGVRFF
jgi:hypothetical protein